MLLLLILFQTKHLIIDWLWQPPFEFMNKGTYGHWGGIRHALKHAIGTATCLSFIPIMLKTYPLIFAFSCIDFLIHYHIDWAKMNLNSRFHFEPADAKFWWLVGFDQYLHQMTYIFITFLVFGALK